jgi:hypothetical protein
MERDLVWARAVKQAKKKLGKPQYQIVKGNVLKQARRIYCAAKNG